MPKMAMGKYQVHFMRVLKDSPAKTLTFLRLREDVYTWNEQRVRRTLRALCPVFIMHNTVRDTYTLTPAGVAMVQEMTVKTKAH